MTGLGHFRFFDVALLLVAMVVVVSAAGAGAVGCGGAAEAPGPGPTVDGGPGGGPATGGRSGTGGGGSAGGTGTGGQTGGTGTGGQGGGTGGGAIIDAGGDSSSTADAPGSGCPADGGAARVHLDLNEAFFNDPTKSILFVGASITADGRYVDRLIALLKGKFPQMKAATFKRGRNSETLSGLTEVGHPGPRPVLFERLDTVLKEAKPQLVFAADYGLNDGIYSPFDETRFAAFKSGVMRLQAAIAAAGAELIMLTPTPFEANGVAPGQIRDVPPYRWDIPFRGYDQVMARYSEWMLSLRSRTQRVLDIRTPLLDFMKAQQAMNPGYRLTVDGVHPNPAGFNLMGETIFQQLFAAPPASACP